MPSKKWIAFADKGELGQPGSPYTKKWAGVIAAPNGQYELHVRCVWGSNQGTLEEHGRDERRFRAETLDELIKIGVSEIRADGDFCDDSSPFVAAIRDAVYEAQDIVATGYVPPLTLTDLYRAILQGDVELDDDVPVFAHEDWSPPQGVWSWDNTHAIVGTCQDDICLIPRGVAAHFDARSYAERMRR